MKYYTIVGNDTGALYALSQELERLHLAVGYLELIARTPGSCVLVDAKTRREMDSVLRLVSDSLHLEEVTSEHN